MNANKIDITLTDIEIGNLPYSSSIKNSMCDSRLLKRIIKLIFIWKQFNFRKVESWLSKFKGVSNNTLYMECLTKTKIYLGDALVRLWIRI